MASATAAGCLSVSSIAVSSANISFAARCVQGSRSFICSGLGSTGSMLWMMSWSSPWYGWVSPSTYTKPSVGRRRNTDSSMVHMRPAISPVRSPSRQRR